MSAAKRNALISKLHKALKKQYQTHSPPADRSILEHLLYACCLEDARPELADEAFAVLKVQYFDWNEVRVTSHSELGEVMNALPRPTAAANRLKRSLQAVFEEYYTFALEDVFKKLNLGEAVKRIEQLEGVSPFVTAYMVQHAFGGHAIPLSSASLELLRIVGIVSDKDVADRRAPGLERAIPKAKGGEFASLLQQAAAELSEKPQGTKIRGMLVEVNAEAKDRLPSRSGKTKTVADDKPSRSRKTAKASASLKPEKKAAKPAKKAPEKKAAKKKAAARKTAKASTAKSSAKTSGAKSAKSASKRLTKRKPR